MPGDIHCKTSFASLWSFRSSLPHHLCEPHIFAQYRHTNAAQPCSGMNARISAANQSGNLSLILPPGLSLGSNCLMSSRNTACASRTAASACPRWTSRADSAPRTARLARSAKCSEQRVSCAKRCSGLAHTHKRTRPLALKKGSSTRVSRHARYGKWFALCLNACITEPRELSDKFMCRLSSVTCEPFSVTGNRSDPARSAKATRSAGSPRLAPGRCA
mmetsp:Transcript_90128/g.169918  ORF Transcript_90128/g.169918 Transcript_90128/m.169918 type:complete len:218 (+) Transcript_90128:382-1035(+)